MNMEANSYVDMIDWEAAPKTEPPVTMHLTDDELLDVIGAPLHLPPYPCNTLDVESSVPTVTESAMRKIGPVNRHRQLYYQFSCY